MKTIFLASVTLLFVAACTPSTEEMSNPHCSIIYSPELKEMAKDINQEVVALKAQRYSGQLKYELVDNGDVVDVKYELAPEDAHNKNYCSVVALYYQQKYLKDKKGVFRFLKGSTVKTTVKSDELPVEYANYNLSFLCDREVASKDQTKMKQLVASGKLPQESTFWLKTNGGKYNCYAVTNPDSDRELISRLYGAMIREVEKARLSKPVEYLLMDLNYAEIR